MDRLQGRRYPGDVSGRGGDIGEYARKRDPRRTPEPFGGTAPAAGAPAAGRVRPFCIQQHAARRLHYDLRLEMGGVLKSFALPKGPPAIPGERRLAVPTEDHPLEYLEFEGVIPKGEYGAGAMIVWDRGGYELDPKEAKDGPRAAVEAGKIPVFLHGEKVDAAFELIRLPARRPAPGKPPEEGWLMVRRKGRGATLGATAVEEGTEPDAGPPGSVVTGYGLEELAAAAERVPALVAELAAAGAPRRPVRLADVEPALCGARRKAFSSPDWLFELKWDGGRVLSARDGAEVELSYRRGRSATAGYPEVLQAVRALPCGRAIVDGEVVVLGDDGKPSFERLQHRFHLTDPDDVARAALEHPVVYYVFDLIALEDLDLRPLPLERRKAALRELLPARGRRLRYCDHIASEGEAFFRVASERGLEGLIAKRRRSAYRGGRSPDWVKIKNDLTFSLVVVGYSAGKGERGSLGSLHLACRRDGRFRYAGRAGSGLDGAGIDRLLALLGPLRLERPAPEVERTELAPPGTNVWVEPKLVAEVSATGWTDEGMLRHPVFRGLREDLGPEDCSAMGAAGEEREGEREGERAGGGGGAGDEGGGGEGKGEAPPAPPPAPAPAKRARAPARYPLSNPTKVLWPDAGIAKAEVLAYYDTIAPFILPFLRDRPVTVVRYPDGIAGKSFFQKAPKEGFPDWVRVVRVPDDEKPDELVERIVCEDERTLAYLANLAAIVLHLPSVRLSAGGRPDWIVLDLDPKEAPFGHVVELALHLREVLDDLGAPSAIKTSGGTGLHVLVPTGAKVPGEAARQLALLIARLVEAERPDIATTARMVRARGGKVYVDYGQNLTRTIVAPYSPRARPGAPVSTPLRWDEVTRDLRPDDHTLRTVPARLERDGDILAPVVLGPGIDLPRTLARLEARIRKAASR